MSKRPDLAAWNSSKVAGGTPPEPPLPSGDPATDTHLSTEDKFPQKISDQKIPPDINDTPPITRLDQHNIIGGATYDPAQIALNRARIAEQRRLDNLAAKERAQLETRTNAKVLLAAEREEARILERERIRLAKEAARQRARDKIAAKKAAAHLAKHTPPPPIPDATLTAASAQSTPPPAPPSPDRAAQRAHAAQAQRVQDLITLAGGPAQLLAQIRRQKAEQSLYEFVKQAWPYMDPVPFVDSWHIREICRHLEAVTRGKIRRLIINVPPRSSKSTIVSVAWPAWVWAQEQRDYGPLSGPHVQMLFASYAQTLSERDAVKCRRLMESKWYQDNWGKNFSMVGDQNTKRRYENSAKGYRIATSVGGTLTGEGGALIVCDDAISADEASSEADRTAANLWWDETMSTRLNDPRTGAYVIIMQRLHEDDLTGHILTKDRNNEYTHLMLPMRYDSRRACVTYVNNQLFFEDPRSEDGELLCPQRFDETSVRLLEQELGPSASSGQLQQSPTPRGGGIIKREWWNLWPPPEETAFWTADLPGPDGITAPRITYPTFDFICASLDCAATEKEENDYSACTVWGTFTDRRGQPKIMLISSWRGHYAIHDLVARVLRTAKRTRLECDALLIENKSNGHALAQELKRLTHPGDFTLHLLDPRKDGGGDKVARMYAVQPTFAANLIYAPETAWAETVIAEAEAFPKGKHDDLCDTVSMAINWLRKRGLARMPFEHEEDIRPKIWTSDKSGVTAHYDI